jgi:hypothetical protein
VGKQPQAGGGAYGDSSPRDLLADRRIIDTVLPPLVFVGVEALAGLRWAAGASIGLAIVLVAGRLLRRQRLLYAVSGLGGALLGVGFALWSGGAEAYFVPGIVGSAALGVACVGSILVRRPLIALTSAAIYRWPLPWYWHPRVRPAYSEITWVWAALYLAKAAIQAVLVEQRAVGVLAVVRIATGWPAFALLLVCTYAYVRWRLDRLGAPEVDEFRDVRA